MEKTDLLITLTHAEDNENNVTIAFAMGEAALDKGHKVELVLLSHAVSLGRKEESSIDIGDPFPAVKDARAGFLAKGGVLKICKACMVHNGVDESELIDGAVVITAPDVIDAIMNADKSLQLN